MLRPSYTELMEILNEDADLDNKITSRYTIVIAAAKRARQIIDGADCNAVGVSVDKAVTIAVNEMAYGEIKILPEGPELEPELETAESEDMQSRDDTLESSNAKATEEAYEEADNDLDDSE